VESDRCGRELWLLCIRRALGKLEGVCAQERREAGFKGMGNAGKFLFPLGMDTRMEGSWKRLTHGFSSSHLAPSA